MLTQEVGGLLSGESGRVRVMLAAAVFVLLTLHGIWVACPLNPYAEIISPNLSGSDKHSH